MGPSKQPKLSGRRRRQITDLWSCISNGEISDIEQALAAIPIEPGEPDYIIVRAVLSLFMERGPTLLGTFDIYTEMAYLFAEVILDSTPRAVVSLMHIAAIPPHFSLPLLAHLVDRPEYEVKPYFDEMTDCRIVNTDGNGRYWFPPTFRDCLLLHWFQPENQPRYRRVAHQLEAWERGETPAYETNARLEPVRTAEEAVAQILAR